MADYLDEILAEAGVVVPTETTGTLGLGGDSCAGAPQRENLPVLTASGQTKEYHLGKSFSLEDIEKLSEAEVQRLHARYEAVLPQKMHKTAVGGVLRVAVKVLGLVLPYVGLRLRDEPALLEALQIDELLITELSAASMSYIVNTSISPFIALASAALTTGTHVESDARAIEEAPPAPKDE
ncbi:hypothetical protein QZH41_002127 [Actinostola sp. cb2023]|nr:hypothetical protein QZH41_002127 [Actinostola sp. cb2023]